MNQHWGGRNEAGVSTNVTSIVLSWFKATFLFRVQRIRNATLSFITKDRPKLTAWLFVSSFSAIFRQAGHCIYSRCLVKNFINESQETSNLDVAINDPGGGTQKNVYRRRLHPKVQPLTLLYTIFHEKGTPFVYPLLTNGTPFTDLV